MLKRFALFFAIAIFTMALAACGGGDDNGDEGAANGNGGGEEYEISMTEMQFEPAEITVPAGTEVTINVVNDGSVHHDYVSEELGIELGADPGGSDSTTTTFDEPGEYEVICTEPGHAAAGMTGTIIVE